jgi:thiol-disulfide isomerase/thioredoxin
VRNLAWISLVTAGLVVGCTGPSKRAKPPPPSSFRAGGDAPTGTAGNRTQPSRSGLLAGTVKDAFDRPVAKAAIQVVARPEGRTTAPAPIEIQTDEQGCFYIPGLDPGQPYQLIARLREGDKIVKAGSSWARPPNPCLLIQIREELVTQDTPPVPSRQTYPEEKADKGKKKNKTPAASIDKPVVPHQELTSGADGSSPPPEPHRPPRLDHVISIPPQPPSPETPDLPAVPRLTTTEPPAVAPLSRKPLTPPPLPRGERGRGEGAPWCSLYGKQLEDFALFDLDGKVWQFRRDRRRKLVLLDFWSTRCPPCLRAIPHLNGLQQEYGPSGLEVIGIACDADPPSQRAMRVRSLRWGATGQPVRFEYRVLLWGDRGPGRPCPVYTDFGILRIPAVKLIDENGRIVWESVGLDGSQLNKLRREIEYRLNLSRR